VIVGCGIPRLGHLPETFVEGDSTEPTHVHPIRTSPVRARAGAPIRHSAHRRPRIT
jgi:hypothetical protein